MREREPQLSHTARGRVTQHCPLRLSRATPCVVGHVTHALSGAEFKDGLTVVVLKASAHSTPSDPGFGSVRALGQLDARHLQPSWLSPSSSQRDQWEKTPTTQGKNKESSALAGHLMA